MRQPLILAIIALLVTASAVFAEIDSDLKVTICDKINHSALGINGTVFPQNLTRERYAFGFEFGMQLIERYLHDRGSNNLHADTNGTDIDYIVWFNKNYRDYMFLPAGVIFRYDLTDPGKLNKIRPSVFLGVGGVLNVYQESVRQIQDIFEDYPDPGEPLLYRLAIDTGGKSIATFDFYVKPKIALFYSRMYASYEMYYGTEFLRHTISIGYVFRL